MAPRQKRGRKRNRKATTLVVQMPPMEVPQINAIEGILGYQFQDRDVLAEALTHATFCMLSPGGRDYQRLEFIGDVVLNYVMAVHVFKDNPDLDPGWLTQLRSANVDRETLARIAVSSGLHPFLRHNLDNFESEINEFLSDIKIYPAHSYGLVAIPKVLSDIVESLLGAVFVDSNSNHETIWQVFTTLSPSLINLDQLGRHPVSELQALCGSLCCGDAKYDDSNWSKTYTVDVLIAGKVVGSATYAVKKCICRNRAGKAALDNLKGLINNNQIDSFFGANI